MLGDRVKKPRTFSDGIPPLLKKRKTNPVPNSLEVPAAEQPAPPKTKDLQQQKRVWRLSEIVRKDREARRQKTGMPSFVFQAPHMDTRRPQRTMSEGNLPPKAPPKSSTSKGGKKVQTDLRAAFGRCVHNTNADAPGVRSHGAIAASGGEAILYSRNMLPKSHLVLLDVLIALESATSLLKTRRTLTTFGAVQSIVRSSTRRDFTLKILSQLAHIVPEAVSVLPGLKSNPNPKRRSNGFIIRLDDVDPMHCEGDEKSAARIRRSLLHKRLLENVREHHTKFLQKAGIKRYSSDLWHHSFDLEKDVKELPAPPLYPESIPTSSSKATKKISAPRSETAPETSVNQKDDIPAKQKDYTPVKQKKDSTEGPESSEDVSDSEDSLPASLLEKVRARAKAKEVHDANAEIEKSTNRSLLSKLPCTMDTICTVLRGERRSAMGWSQLLAKVGKLHPKKWHRDDLEQQIDAIVDIGSVWCRKIELKSSRGGFAFRVISGASFGQARSKVSETTSYPSNSK